MKAITLEIPGIPQSQKRHRHTRIGNGIRTYDPSSGDKESFIWKAIISNKPKTLIITEIEIDITFFMPRPKAHYGTGLNANILKSNMPLSCTKKPDLDNLVKFVFDAFNGIYWKDDSQIAWMRVSKVYDEQPKTLINIVYYD